MVASELICSAQLSMLCDHMPASQQARKLHGRPQNSRQTIASVSWSSPDGIVVRAFQLMIPGNLVLRRARLEGLTASFLYRIQNRAFKAQFHLDSFGQILKCPKLTPRSDQLGDRADLVVRCLRAPSQVSFCCTMMSDRSGKPIKLHSYVDEGVATCRPRFL